MRPESATVALIRRRFASTPCNLRSTESAILAGAVADGRPITHRVSEPGEKHGSPCAVPSNPNSRRGRSRSALRQGWDKMVATFVGIDVSKDRLDVHVRPAAEIFSVSRDAAGLEQLVERIKPFEPQIIGIEASGKYEALVVAALIEAGLPVVVVNPAQVRDFAKALGKRAKTD